jgi:uncharacterized membrane protein YccC
LRQAQWQWSACDSLLRRDQHLLRCCEHGGDTDIRVARHARGAGVVHSRALEGWALAAGAGTLAHTLLWPSSLRAGFGAEVEHAVSRSVWLRNSVRGAVGLAVAVFIARETGLQHAFWVVLGTLSVLRSNALSTGWSILSALGGTALGILVGVVIVIAVGTHEPVPWGVLPLAILLASYAPRAISFAAGQAGFTVFLVVLFNLIQPAGWEVGLVRIEDVAVGFGVSLGVGLLFWPRGAGRDVLNRRPSRAARSSACSARGLGRFHLDR